jgi:cyclopropane-fatty-acyl-phospholipid synthase
MREFEPLYVRAFLKLLENCPFGTLSLKGPNGKVWHFKGENLGVEADIEIQHWGAIKAALSRGDIGFGEAYVQGLWNSSNISNLVSYGIGNINYLRQYINGNIFQRYVTYLINILFKKNTLSGSRQNIMSHYDLGNNFYELWLDSTMTYSSGLRYSGTEDLEQSQRQKYARFWEN